VTRIVKKFLLLAGVLLVAACTSNPRQLNVSLNGRALLQSWRCENAEERVTAEAPQADGQPATIAQKLLQCPFYRDYQIQAMQNDTPGDIGADALSEIIYKIRWGINYQYSEYEDRILNGPKKRFFIPRLLDRNYPLLGDVLELGDVLNDNQMSVGSAGSLVSRQMQVDRAASSSVIDSRLAGYKAGKKLYPLWQAMIDLDGYYRAGTILSAIESLNRGVTAKSKIQLNL